MHPTVAFVASVFVIWLLMRAVRRKGEDNRGLIAVVLLLLAAVYVLGLLDVTLLAPLWAQVAHLLAADSLWVSLVVLTARLTLVTGNRESSVG
jgi:cytochrome c oxidase assembly protein subunit 15